LILGLSPAKGGNPIVYGAYPLIVAMDTTATDRAGFEDWIDIIAAEFPQGCIVIVGHGNDIGGQWAIFPTSDDVPFDCRPFAGCPVPLDWLCHCLRHDYGDAIPIVILSCNPCHDRITDIPNCWQATESIWITPDAYVASAVVLARSMTEPNVVGTFDRFRCFYGDHTTKPTTRPTTKP
jgi:hypothetical protein